MPVTKRGIYHNLKESKYVASNGEVTFYFSSELYLTKFLNEYEQNRINFLSKMAKIVVNSYLNMEILADITLYCTIEKRGFYARMKGVNNPRLSLPINKEDLHKYALRKMMSSEVSGWV
jgi:YHS domain-containing protein